VVLKPAKSSGFVCARQRTGEESERERMIDFFCSRLNFFQWGFILQRTNNIEWSYRFQFQCQYG
jgi:hypothetical protein